MPNVTGAISNINAASVPSSYSNNGNGLGNHQVMLDLRGSSDKGGANNEFASSGSSRVFPIIADLPESFNLQFSSTWTAPFENATAGGILSSVTGGRVDGQLIDVGLGAAGKATRMKAQTFRVWESSSPLTFSLDLVFQATSNARQDVRNKHLALLKLAAPFEKNGALMPPGPCLVGQAIDGSNSRSINLHIGNYLFLENVVIDSVSSDVKTLFTAEGMPIAMSIAISVSSFYTSFTSNDIDKMFRE